MTRNEGGGFFFERRRRHKREGSEWSEEVGD